MEDQLFLSGISQQDFFAKLSSIIQEHLNNRPEKLPEKTSAYLTRKEVAKLLNITLPTLHDYTKQGWLKPYKIGNRVLYNECEVALSVKGIFPGKKRKGDLMLKRKTDYSCVVFFETGEPKKWKFVHKLNGFASFLNNSHPGWKYFNVYDRREETFLTRFYPNNVIPNFLPVLVLIILSTFIPLNSTFNKPVAAGSLTFNGFNNSATISNSFFKEGGEACQL